MAEKLAGKYHFDLDLAGDVLQEGITLLIKRIQDDRFEFNPEYGFKSFLYRTFQNLSMNFNKKYKIFLSEELGDFVKAESKDMDYFETYREVEPEYDLEERVGGNCKELRLSLCNQQW